MGLVNLAIRAGRSILGTSVVKSVPKTLETFVKRVPKEIDKEVLYIGKNVFNSKSLTDSIKIVQAKNPLEEVILNLGGMKMKMFYKA